MSDGTGSFENRLQRLQEIVNFLENGNLPLNESVSLYKEGLLLSRSCREQLEKAKNEVRILSEGELQDFTITDDESDENISNTNDTEFTDFEDVPF